MIFILFLKGSFLILQFPVEPNDSLMLPDRWGMTSLSSSPGARTEAGLLLEPVVVAVHHQGCTSLGEDKIQLIFQRERRTGVTGGIVAAGCNPNQGSGGSAV
jgi:hypothetical protein